MKKEIILRNLKPLSEDYPIVSYETKHFGQSYYLLQRCKEKGIRAEGYEHDVKIFAKTKIPEFIGLIKESLEYTNKKAPSFDKGTVTLKGVPLEKKVPVNFGVYIGKCNTCYVLEKYFGDVVYHIFKKQLPHPEKFIIFSTMEGLEERLEKDHGVFI